MKNILFFLLLFGSNPEIIHKTYPSGYILNKDGCIYEIRLNSITCCTDTVISDKSSILIKQNK